MKTTILRSTLIICGIFAVFDAGFFFGGVYASTRAAREANAASLIYFAGIHNALDAQKYDRVALITNTAVDGHVGVLQELGIHPWMASGYVLPWTLETRITATGLSEVRRAYTAQPDQLRPETRDFLATAR